MQLGFGPAGQIYLLVVHSLEVGRVVGVGWGWGWGWEVGQGNMDKHILRDQYMTNGCN